MRRIVYGRVQPDVLEAKLPTAEGGEQDAIIVRFVEQDGVIHDFPLPREAWEQMTAKTSKNGFAVVRDMPDVLRRDSGR